MGFAVAVKTQIQWRGEDQNYWQHIHGCYGAECDPWTRVCAGTNWSSCVWSKIIIIILNRLQSLIRPIVGPACDAKSLICAWNVTLESPRVLSSLFLFWRTTTGSTCTLEQWWSLRLLWWGSLTSSTNIPLMTSSCEWVSRAHQHFYTPVTFCLPFLIGRESDNNLQDVSNVSGFSLTRNKPWPSNCRSNRSTETAVRYLGEHCECSQ